MLTLTICCNEHILAMQINDAVRLLRLTITSSIRNHSHKYIDGRSKCPGKAQRGPQRLGNRYKICQRLGTLIQVAALGATVHNLFLLELERQPVRPALFRTKPACVGLCPGVGVMGDVSHLMWVLGIKF